MAGLQAVEHRALQALALLALRPASELSTERNDFTHKAAQQLSSLGSSMVYEMEKVLRFGYGTGLRGVMCRSITPL